MTQSWLLSSVLRRRFSLASTIMNLGPPPFARGFLGPPGPPMGGPPPPFVPAFNSPYYQSITMAQQQAEAAAAAANSQRTVVAHSLCASLVQDNLAKDQPDWWPLLPTGDVCWVVEVGTGDNRIHNILDALQVPHKVISAEQLYLAKLNPSQTIFVNCWDENLIPMTIDPDSLNRLVQFVADGGQLVTFNGAIRMLEVGFPGKVAAGERFIDRPGLARVTTKLHKEDRSLSMYTNLTLECVLEVGTRAVKILDKSAVTLLATLPPNLLGDRAAVVRFQHGSGTVYHMCCELVEKERVSSESEAFIPPYLTRSGATAETQQVWKCARECGFESAFSIAQLNFPFMYFLTRLLCQHKLRYKDWKPPPETVGNDMMSMPNPIEMVDQTNHGNVAPQQHQQPEPENNAAAHAGGDAGEDPNHNGTTPME